MRTALALVAGALLGALVTYLWLPQECAPSGDLAPRADPEGLARAESSPAEAVGPGAPDPNGTPTLEARPGPAKPKVVVEGGGVSITHQGAELGEIIRELQRAFRDESLVKDKRIQELEAQIARLEVTLPKPEILARLEEASIADFQNLLREIRSIATKRLLTPPDHVQARYAEYRTGDRTGLARILPRGKYDLIVEPRGGGAYWSFKTGSNSYDAEPDLELQNGEYHTSFYGGTTGFLMDLGDHPIDDVDADPDRPPAGLDETGLARWAWLWKEAEPRDEKRPDRRELRGENPGLTDRVKAEPRHTYLLRAILPGEHDILVVFRPVDEDETGVTLIYRILHEFEMPKRR